MAHTKIASGIEVEELADGHVWFTFHNSNGENISHQIMTGTLDDLLDLAEGVRAKLADVRAGRHRTLDQAIAEIEGESAPCDDDLRDECRLVRWAASEIVRLAVEQTAGWQERMDSVVSAVSALVVALILEADTTMHFRRLLDLQRSSDQGVQD